MKHCKVQLVPSHCLSYLHTNIIMFFCAYACLLLLPLPLGQVDLNDRRDFSRQLFDQTLLDDPDIPGFQPALPEDFDWDEFAKEAEQEARAAKRAGRR